MQHSDLLSVTTDRWTTVWGKSFFLLFLLFSLGSVGVCWGGACVGVFGGCCLFVFSFLFCFVFFVLSACLFQYSLNVKCYFPVSVLFMQITHKAMFSVSGKCCTHNPKRPFHCRRWCWSFSSGLTLIADISVLIGDHKIRHRRLEFVSGNTRFFFPFLWSYLAGRTYTSNPPTLPYCIPQGWILGPTLFLLYRQPLLLIIDKHSFP